MKRFILLLSLFWLFTFDLKAQVATTGTTQVNLPAPTAFTATPKDGNSCIWQRTVYVTDSTGSVVPQNHSYVQLEAGMNHLVNNQWVPSKEEIDLQSDGWAAATNGQYQAFFPGDLYQSAVTVVGPKGQILQCRPEVLCYVDGTNYAVIATAQDSYGVLASSNVVIYPGAFTNVNADVRYTYHKSGFEQDIILRQQPPLPESFGLNPQTTRIEVFTEFFDPPSPTSDGQFTDPASGLTDNSLDFDGMNLTMGKAFSTTDTNQDSVEGAPVFKSWITTSDGRTLLVEKVPYSSIAEPLSALPLQSSIDNLPANHPLLAASDMLPPSRPINKHAGSVLLSKRTSDGTPGLVLDYVLLPVSLVNQTFQADTTYLMGPYYFELDGTVTFEGGTVIKFQSSTAQFKLNNFNLICLSGPYRPIILTAQDDNTVGETVSGSTGSPSGYYGQGVSMYNSTNLTVFHDVRMSYLNQGFITWVPTEFDNIQAINCSTPITHAGYDVTINNALFYNTANTAVSSGGFSSAIRGTHLTVDICSTFADSTTTILGLTNCLFTATTNLLVGTGTLTTNSVAVLASNSGIYQTVGAGSHYLASGSPYHGIGNTNISPTVLASLASKTTYPPLIYSNQTFSVSTNLQLQAKRDTNAAPDLGYHYDPLDYITDNSTVTNATLTVTNGVAIACYNEPGIELRDGSAVVSIGTPVSPNWFVRYNTVQEQPVFLGGTNANGGQNINSAPFGTDAPSATFQFTHFSELADGGFVFNHSGNNSFSTLTVQHSEIWDGTNILSGGTNSATATFFNNLFFRSGITASNTSSTAILTMTNNLIYAAAVSLVEPTGGIWGFYNNDVDSATVDPNTSIPNGYNAFINCSTNLPGTGTFTSTNAIGYKTGVLGSFYQPTSSPLINEGNVPANQLNLTYFTTLTNQVIETNTLVDIGYHYVALGTNELPLVGTNGVPFYLGAPQTNQILGSLYIWIDSPTNGTTVN